MMNKIKFNIKNALQYSKFLGLYPFKKVEYPNIIEFLDRKYGVPVFSDHFYSSDNWNITDRDDWGSARPGNLCIFVKENVTINSYHGKNSLIISTRHEEAKGKGWNGEEITRPLSSGLITSKLLLHTDQVISATVNTSQSYPGSWFAFWFLKKDVAGDDRYREIDIFEKFMEKPGQKRYSVSIHGGTKNSREMMSFSYPLFPINEEKLTFTCVLRRSGIRIYVNNLLLCVADEPDFEGEYYIMFNDAPSTHDGKVKAEDIIQSLPRTLEIMDFRIYNL